jgi:hypothetical protein
MNVWVIFASTVFVMKLPAFVSDSHSIMQRRLIQCMYVWLKYQRVAQSNRLP